MGSRHHLHILDHHAELEPQFAGMDVVIDLGGSVGTRKMLEAAGSVKLWQILGTGIEHFDLDYWRRKGMAVAYCPGPLSATALAECALMYMLMLARRVPEARANVDAMRWYAPAGCELVGRTLGLIGFGASARELALRAKAFGMRLEAIDVAPPSHSDALRYQLEFSGTPDALAEVLPRADFVSLHLPLTDETRHILDARRLGLMKASAYVINVARGALVDEDALVDALLESRLAGAGLDVFGKEPLPIDSPLRKLANVILTPHVAGATDLTAEHRAELAAQNCDRVAAGLEPLHRIA